MRRACKIFLLLLASVIGMRAQTTFSVMSSADTFVTTGPPGNDLSANNYGGAGALLIAPASSGKGEFQTIMRFDLAGSVDAFNTSLGTNNWVVSAVTLDFTSNFPTNGQQPNNMIFPVVTNGNFVIAWFTNDVWSEGTGNPTFPTTDGVTFSTLSNLLSSADEILCTNTYLPPGGINLRLIWNLPLRSGFVSDVAAGGLVSLRFYSDGPVGYLFNAYNFGRTNQPFIHVTTVQAPPLQATSLNRVVGGIQISGLGAANVSYGVRAATNLLAPDWKNLGSVTADGAGLLQFNDVDITSSQRFYQFYHKPGGI